MTDLAILYNDDSILENHHASVAFKLLFKNDMNIFVEMDAKEFKEFRRIVIHLILMTDPSKHFLHYKQLQKLLD